MEDLQPRIRTAATLGVLTILMLLALVWGWTKLTEPVPSLSPTDQEPAEACSLRTVAKGEKVDPAEVTVSVFNAGTTDGQATKTMARLVTRGFAAGDTGNAPSGTDVDKVQIWADDPKNPAVRLVRSHLGKAVKVRPAPEELGVGVVIVVGDEFKKLADGDRAVTARADAQICSPN